MSQTVDQNHEAELMQAMDDSIIDAEFKILTESNEQTAMTQSGLAILFQNWTNQE